MLENPEKALEICRQALSRSAKAAYPKGRSDSTFNAGWCKYYLSQFKEALADFSDALKSYREQSDRIGEMKALNAFGAVYHAFGKFDTAVDYYMQCLDKSRETGDPEREASSLNNLGELFRECGNGEEAIRYFLGAMDVLAKIENEELSAIVFANVGSSFKAMGNYTLALEYLEAALQLSRKAKDRISEAKCLNYLGQISAARKLTEEADSYYAEALALCESSKNSLGRVSVLQNLGDLRLEQERVNEALDLYRESLDLAERLGTVRFATIAYRSISAVYEQLGDSSSALRYFRKFYDSERVSLNEETKNRVRNITVQYEIEKSQREAEIYRLKNVELKEKTEQLADRNRQILTIASIGQRITSSLDMEAVMRTVYKNVSELMDISGFGIALHDEETGTIHYKLFIEEGKRIEPFDYLVSSDSSLAAWCIRNRRELVINDAERERSKYVKVDGQAVGIAQQSLIYLPMMMGERIVGVLTAQSQKKNAYAEQDLQLLKALSVYIAIALENSRNHDRVNRLNELLTAEKNKLEDAARRIEHMANHDNLTGLPNRRLLLDLLANALPQADRSGAKVAVLYMDLDDFKPINDNFGHDAGDTALIAFSERLKNLLRASDTIARIGGDEFIVLVTNIKQKEDVKTVLDKLFAEGSRPYAVMDQECIIRFSIGAAMYPDDDATVEGLISKADQAMYAVKRMQKHAYEFYDEMGLTRGARGTAGPESERTRFLG